MKGKKGYKHGYRSGLEDTVASLIKEHTKQTGKYESEKISFTEPEKQRKYTPDFVLIKKDGTKMYIETKGRWVAEDRKKHKLIKDQYPELDIRLVFQSPNNKIRKGSKTTYAQWADKLNIPWAKKEIPQSWFNEVK